MTKFNLEDVVTIIGSMSEGKKTGEICIRPSLAPLAAVSVVPLGPCLDLVYFAKQLEHAVQ